MDIYYTDRFGPDSCFNTSAGLISQILKTFYTSGEPKIVAGDRGKPFDADGSGMKFSISHSGSSWICAVGRREAGVDLEYLDRRISSPERLAEKAFAPEETEYILRGTFSDEEKNREGEIPVFYQLHFTEKSDEECPALSRSRMGEDTWKTVSRRSPLIADSLRRRLIFMWTVKEAFLKFTGEGLNGLRSSALQTGESKPFEIKTFVYGDRICSLCTERD